MKPANSLEETTISYSQGSKVPWHKWGRIELTNIQPHASPQEGDSL